MGQTMAKKDGFYSLDNPKSKKKKKQKKYPKSARVRSRGDYWVGRRGGMFALGHYGHDHDHGDTGGGDGGGDGGGMGESVEKEEPKKTLLSELLGGALPGAFTANVLSATQFGQNHPAGKRKVRAAYRFDPETYEEEAEVTQQGQKGNKIDQARQLFQGLVNRPDMNRQAMIQAFQDQVGVTNSTAVSYYERLAKEAGMTNQDDQQDLGLGVDMRRGPVNGPAPVEELPADTDMELNDQVEFEDPDRAGVIRTVDDAHLVYKRQTEDGSFEELWLYNIGNSVNDELNIRRDILAGTDIPPKATKSPDGSQHYAITTLGNAQYLNVMGLPN